MKSLLQLVGWIFVIAGIATGVVSQMDYGNALIGLNLGLAATLLVGGFIVMGLGAVAGAVSLLTEDLPDTPTGASTDAIAPITAGTAGATAGAAGTAVGSQFDETSKNIDTAIDKVAEVANEAKDKAADKVAEVAEDVKDTADNAVDATKQAVGDAIDEVAEKTETSSDSDTKDKEETKEASDITQVNGADPAEDKKEGDADQLYVVEELVIRGKAARVLSDNTVEAETAEGWMRFENVEHLEEYLDAMGV